MYNVHILQFEENNEERRHFQKICLTNPFFNENWSTNLNIQRKHSFLYKN